MNFEFSEEQNMLRDSLARLLSDTYDFDARKKIIESDEGWSRDIWKTLAELGVFAAAFPEEYDGFGGTASDSLVIMEELGRVLLVEPFLPTVILCGQILRAIGGDHAQALIPQIISGDAILGFGHAEPKSRSVLSSVETSAVQDGEDYILNGHKAVVLAAPIADKLIVSARVSGDKKDTDGLSLFIMDATHPGITIQPYKTIDGLQAGDVLLENVTLPAAALLGPSGKAYDLIEAIMNAAILAVSAEGVGVCKRMCELTNEYIQTRKQFGQAIGAFQVLQHKMVDMFIHKEELISMTYMGAAKMDSGDYNNPAVASAIKVQLGETCKFVGENAVQLHGGMGITEEMAVGHYFMRATMLELLFGNTDFHLGRFQRAAVNGNV